MEYCGGGGSPSGLIEKYLGEAYSNVLAVADHMDELVAVAASLGIGGNSGMPNGAAGFAKFATRAELAPSSTSAQIAYLFEIGREGMFVWNSSNLSALVAADPAQGLFVAPALDTTGATGAWVRLVSGPTRSTWWGVSTTNTPDQNVIAFNAALQTLAAMAIVGHGYANGSASLYTPTGLYQFNGQLTPESAVRIFGDFLVAGGGTVFRWTNDDTHGIYLRGWDGASRHASGSEVDNIIIEGLYNGPANRKGFNAIEVNTTVNIHDIFVDHWPGRAVNGHADLAANQGDMNGSEFKNISAQVCDWTLWIQGADANGCTVYNINGSSNRFGGYADKSFLGNGGRLGVIADNGFDANFLNRCTVNGHRYSVAYGQEVWCSTNAPTGAATSNQGWTYFAEGGVDAYCPTWVTGQTWFFAAPIIINDDGGNNYGKIFGGYLEGGQNPCVIGGRSILILDAWSGRIVNINGTVTSGIDAGGVMTGNGGAMNFQRDITVGNMATINSQLNVGPATGGADGIVYLNGMNTGPQIWFQRPNVGVDGYIMYVNGASYWNALGGHNIRVGGNDIAGISAAGLNLVAGKTLSINGTQVVGPRQTGLPADATDAASTQALVNALRAALIAHGLVS